MLAPDAISAGPSEATAGFEVALHPSVNVGNPLANGSLGASTRAGMRREIAGQRGGAGWTRTSDRRIISSHGVHSYASCGISAARGGGLHLENYARAVPGEPSERESGPGTRARSLRLQSGSLLLMGAHPGSPRRLAAGGGIVAAGSGSLAAGGPPQPTKIMIAARRKAIPAAASRIAHFRRRAFLPLTPLPLTPRTGHWFRRGW
jgi:hypothetical protein